MKRVLMSGAAGFLGSHLSQTFLKAGYQVFGLDNFYTGSRRNLKTVLENENFSILDQDVSDSGELPQVDLILNFACPASPKSYQRDHIFTLKTCFSGTLRLLEHARDLRVPLVQASTSEVYGDPKSHPQNEDYWGNVNPIGLRSCYDEGKRVAESLCINFQRQYGCDVRIIRIFNTYGPYMAVDDGRVVSNFIVQALRGDDLTVYGSGEQSRSFCYVSDLVAGIVKVAGLPDMVAGPINLGNDQELSVKTLAEKVISLTKSKSKVKFVPLPSDDPVVRRPDLQRARSLLAWEPCVALEAGLQQTIAYFDGVL